MSTVEFSELKATIKKAFLNVGLTDEQAETCAAVHAESSLEGIYSHGLNRVPRFCDYVKKGFVDIKADVSVVKDHGPIVIQDGNQGIGILNAIYATNTAIAKAREFGMGMVGLRNTTHWMRGGTYGYMAAKSGMALISWTNTEACMPAWGAESNRVGNNPYVMAIPGKNGPMILDMAMSQYSYGKLQVTRLKGEQLPFPGGFDKNGKLTSDPGAIEESMRILPTGYWKGSGFAILLDAFAAFLSEGNPTYKIDRIQRGSCTGASQIFICFDPNAFGGLENCEKLTAAIGDYVNGSTPDREGGRVTFPGQRSRDTRAHNLEHGVPVDDDVWKEVKALAK